MNTLNKLLIILLSNVSFIFGTHLEFRDYKSNGQLGDSFFKIMHHLFQPDIFIETGTYNGGTCSNAAPYFKEIHTSEIHPQLFQSSQKKLHNYEHIHVYNEPSYETFERILPHLNGKMLFWLDAHYSGEGTSLSFNDDKNSEAITAIRKELKTIKQFCKSECLILIDDIRGFGTKINDTKFLGCWAYPTMQEVTELILDINPGFEIVLLKDTLLAYDKKYTVSISPVAKACTMTRLYDGHNLSDTELLDAEKVIMNAQGIEKDAIGSLYTQMTNCKDPLFIHDLWYGLINMGDKNYRKALEALIKISPRIQFLDENKNSTNITIDYNHWRINHYIQICKDALRQ